MLLSEFLATETGAVGDPGPFRVVRKLGRGAFAEVFEAEDRESGEHVAVKKIFIRDAEKGVPDNVAREAEALSRIGHANVLALRDVYIEGSYLCLATELAATSVHDVIASVSSFVPLSVAKGIAQQLLRGLAAVHKARILHRDLKPSNVLIAPGGRVKLADFGLARPESVPCHEGASPRYTHAVATRWYRAPELLYGARSYGPAVDVWAAGCIIAEVLALSPLFPGHSDILQLGKVLEVLGPVDLDEWPQAASLPDWGKVEFEARAGIGLRELLPHIDRDAFELVESLVAITPSRRVGAAEALRHRWFSAEPGPASAGEIWAWLKRERIV